jgi:integrase
MHVNPVLGHVPVRDLTVADVEDLDAQLARRKNVTAETRNRVLTELGAVLECATRWGYTTRNVARLVPKTKAASNVERSALTAPQVEQVRHHVLHRRSRTPHLPLMDAALISLLAYGGLRIGEARGLLWGDLHGGRVRVQRSLRDDRPRPTKTGKNRTVALIEPVLEDLAAWRAACPSTSASAPMFPGPTGNSFASKNDRQNWARRVFRPAAAIAGVPNATVYCLRHTCVTLLVNSGLPVAAVAGTVGHAPSLSLDTYSHAYEEFDIGQRRPLVEQVREAREALAVATT